MKKYITNGVLFTPNERVDDAVVVIDGDLITEVRKKKSNEVFSGDVIDASGHFITPGFIDIHFHGAMGKDAMDAELTSLKLMSDFCAGHAVTSFYPTTWSAGREDIFEAIKCVKENQHKVKGAQILGVHVEGPYVDLKYRGAQLPSMIRKPDRSEYQEWFDSGVVKIITCAPEVEGCQELIKESVANDVRIAVGHSQATYEQVIAAADLGVTQATHIFNGMVGLHHRDPGTVGGVLDDDRILAQVICDGVHLHPAVVRLVLCGKTESGVVLITDAVRGAGLPDGDYENKGQRFSVRDGVARTPEGGLSGSTLTLDQALRNFIKFTRCTLEDALTLVTLNPAREMGLLDHKGKLASGYDADIVILNESLEVEKTLVKGEIVYTKEKK